MVGADNLRATQSEHRPAQSHPRILDVLDVERIDGDVFRGRVVPSTLRRTFGGQVAAQALVAATRTVQPDYGVHSLHAYFVAAGNSDLPILLTVTRIRDGRSFCSRSVEATQEGRPIFVMQASFHVSGDEGPEHSDAMRAVPDPEDVVVDRDDMTPVRRALLQEWSDWDIRILPADSYEPNKYAASQQVVWFKSKAALPDDETLHVCTLAYMSDMTLLSSALVPHEDMQVQEASLDHAMWFLRPFRADEWLLYDQISPSAHAGRAITHGRIFNRQGQLVAIVTQEGLTRALLPGKHTVPWKDPANSPGNPQ
ncbi:acyl-CoA thioesterase [Corynebacterium heidelbergense]|uniref:Acyl-CoA thioesterase 2 n=1 Tax=Corynebacterium heidelbergense TaxID=2055947 RepID=A0A364VD88_9CORY|nr:acyl-CoA thioesterase II [Corynebacterium heidelbergense]RAV34594.1 acyl-CoA thioesterase II [Corynebacterium heidelbergense]WCZ36635.1 Acyl-CoA thioesterase 2 [Corynebacterium heidelbergense]